MDSISLRERIRALLETSIERLGFELVAVEWIAERGAAVLRLSVDGPGGVTADDCGRVSSHVSPILDADDPITHAYRLEVSSPGIDRPVQRRADFARFAGYRAKLKLVPGHPRRRYTGTLGAVDGDELTIHVDGAEHRLALDAIERAHLVLDLEEYRTLAEEPRHDDQ